MLFSRSPIFANFLIILLALSTITCVLGQTATPLTDGVFLTTNNNVSDAGSFSYYVFTVPNPGPAFLNFSFVPCFGEMDYYIKRGDFPTTSDYDWRRLWTESQKPSAYFINPPASSQYYVGIYGRNNYPGVASAIFNILAYTNSAGINSLLESIC